MISWLQKVNGKASGSRIAGSNLDETIYTFMLTLSRIVQTGIPLMLVILSSAVLVFSRCPNESGRKAMTRLRITGLFCALVWLFYYAEIWSPRRIPAFDYGAPLISLLALIVLPILALSVWSQRRVLTVKAWTKTLFVLANFLIVFSLAPGIFIILFYAAAMRSGRWRNHGSRPYVTQVPRGVYH